jgi:hypothetical protein
LAGLYYISDFNFKCMALSLLCPECKNPVDLSSYKELKVGQIIECGTCGISLIVEKIEGDNVVTEIVDEGK